MTRSALGGLGLAIAIALGVLGLLPGPASAAGPGISWTSPAEGASFGGSPPISGQVEMGNNGCTDHVTLVISSAQGHPVPSQFDQNSGDRAPMAFNWQPPLAYNGVYTVQATATGRAWPCQFNSTEQSTSSRTFKVEAPPATPAGIKAIVDQAKRTITISWTANGEPDVIGYGVYRKEGSQFVARKVVTTTSYTDDLGSLPAGTYQYQVYAARPNADGSQAIASASPAVTSGKVTTPPPSPPTSTTTPGASGSKGGTGGTTNTTAATTGTSANSPAIANRGKVDLSGFAALLPNGGAKLPAAHSTPQPDGTYNETLPFKANAGSDSSSPGKDDSVSALGGQTLASSSGENRPTSLLFLAAGLLATVLLMHVLWLRDEVNRAPLPAVTPQEPESA
ncbi:MAG: hypothetical protein QOJ09_2869, partial [Actinomycetota bacterium]|nr:hypothetical protein [Actinomycetota bacterium]